MVPPQVGALAEDDADLAYVGDAVPDGVHAEDPNGSGVGGQQPGQQLDRRTLAGPVGARVRDDLAPPHREVDAGECGDDLDLAADEVGQGVAEAFGALALQVTLPDAAELNDGVRTRSSELIRRGHSAGVPS